MGGDSHVHGAWVTCEWEGNSQVDGRMQGESGVNGKVINCDREKITREEGTIKCDVGMITGDSHTNHM